MPQGEVKGAIYSRALVRGERKVYILVAFKNEGTGGLKTFRPSSVSAGPLGVHLKSGKTNSCPRCSLECTKMD